MLKSPLSNPTAGAVTDPLAHIRQRYQQAVSRAADGVLLCIVEHTEDCDWLDVEECAELALGYFKLPGTMTEICECKFAEEDERDVLLRLADDAVEVATVAGKGGDTWLARFVSLFIQDVYEEVVARGFHRTTLAPFLGRKGGERIHEEEIRELVDKARALIQERAITD